MVSREKLVSFEAFEAYIEEPENADRLLELIDGEIVEKVPTEEHGAIVMNIGSPMWSFVAQNKLGRVSTEGLHRLPGDDQNAVLPDISFRSSTTGPVVRKGSVPVMPDLAVEVQSPGQSENFLQKKAAYYLANGARMVILVFPPKRSLQIHQGDTVLTLNENDTLDGGDVLPGFTLPVKDIFALD